ncbi:MAG: SBBP repeat-containing protein, partial [Bacteroidota bacterium]
MPKLNSNKTDELNSKNNKMKKVFLVAALLLMTIQCFSQTPNFQWTNGAGGAGAELGRSVVTDNLGNVYVTGCFASSTITFDTINLTNSNPNYCDIFLVKYSSAGSVIWAKKYGGMGSDIPNSIVLDFSGNIYLVGNYTSHSIIFGADILLNADTSNFYSDLFVAKMDNNGNALWGRGAGGTKNEKANSIT